MDRKSFDKVCEIIKNYQPQNYAEIGVHNGLTAAGICREILKYKPDLHFVGYDAFDEVPAVEHNGKSPSTNKHYEKCLWRFSGLKKDNPQFTWELVKGLTTDTLTTPVKYDFVYIDGGHSYETVKHDYNMVKESKIILFDDYNLKDVKKAISEIGKGELLASYDDWKKATWLIINED